MWMSKRKLREEITRLTYRVQELEERLCPCESHNWKMTGSYFSTDAYGEYFDTVYKYKCSRCGKTIESSRLLQNYLGGQSMKDVFTHIDSRQDVILNPIYMSCEQFKDAVWIPEEVRSRIVIVDVVEE